MKRTIYYFVLTTLILMACSEDELPEIDKEFLGQKLISDQDKPGRLSE